MKKGLVAIIIILILVWVFSYMLKKDTYTGFYYPDKSNLYNNITSDRFFDSLEQCRLWVDTQISKYNEVNKEYDYECGKNCKIEGEKPYTCQETLE